MKRISLLVLLMFASIILIGQNITEYIIEETKGSVKVKYDDSGVESKAKTKMKIYSKDMIVIENGGFVSFYNPKNDKDYRWDKVGTYTVKQIVKNYSENSLFKTFFSFLINQKSDTKIDSRDWHNIGAIIRGVSGPNPMAYESEIAKIIQNQILSGGRRVSEYSEGITLKKIPISSKVFSFEINNSSNDALYVNVFKLLKKGKISCCFDNIYREEGEGRKTMSIFVPAHCIIGFPNYTFFNDKSSFLLIGTKDPFDGVYVEHLVNDSIFNSGSSNWDWLNYAIIKGK